MTDAPNGWPDPARPGVPLNPERRMPHALWNLPTLGGLGPTFWTWDPDEQHWVLGHYMRDAEEAARGWRYLGPCLPPADITAARDAARAERDALQGDLRLTAQQCGDFQRQTERAIHERDAARADAVRLREAASKALHHIDCNLGDTDPQDVDHPLVLACQILSAALAQKETGDE